MVVTSLPDTPVRPVGSTVSLNCTVELNNNSRVIDIPVTVGIEWIGPNEYTDSGMAQRMGSTSTYTSTATVRSFERDQSGNYTCTATVSSTSSLNFVLSTSESVTNMVTVGKKSHSVYTLLFHQSIIQLLLRVMPILDLRCLSLSQWNSSRAKQ